MIVYEVKKDAIAVLILQMEKSWAWVSFSDVPKVTQRLYSTQQLRPGFFYTAICKQIPENSSNKQACHYLSSSVFALVEGRPFLCFR